MPKTFRPFSRFAKDEHGLISVETVIIFPILLWALAAMFVFFDAFKAQNTNVKATYTIADLISRTSDPINDDFIDGMDNVFEQLVSSDQAADIRVSVVGQRLAANGIDTERFLVWSQATGTMIAHTDIEAIEPLIPMMATGDQLIFVESTMLWTPVMSFGLSEMTLSNVAFTSPRFVPQVVYNASASGGDGSDGGLGGGRY